MSPVNLIPLSDTLSVAGQISPADLPAIARAGFKSLICNRPDGESPGQFGHRDPGHSNNTIVATNGVARPDVRRQRQQIGDAARLRRCRSVLDLLGVPRAGRMDVHIRSGAVTPRISKPLAITRRVASHSASRARCRSPGSSSPCGSTRHES